MVFFTAPVRWKTLWRKWDGSITPSARSPRLAGRLASTCLSISTAKRTWQPSAISFSYAPAEPRRTTHMRILYCNKYNFPFSGTEVYMFELMDLMRARGHEVALFSMADPRGQPTPYDQYFLPHIDFKSPAHGLFARAKLAAHAIYSTEARRRLRRMIAEFRPDVAHVRNIYHHLSPSILWELKAQGVPVVYHLNDFKVLCPSYNLVSHGEACEACKGGRFWQTLKQECYPGTAARTALVAEAYFHKWIGTYRKCVDRFLAPSRFVRDKFVEHGWEAEKFDVLPHFHA